MIDFMLVPLLISVIYGAFQIYPIYPINDQQF